MEISTTSNFYNSLTSSLNWDDYKSWLHSDRQYAYADKMFKFSKRFYNIAFTDELITMKSSRTRLEILKALANLTRYLDIRNDTSLHDQFTVWLKRKEIHWSIRSSTNTYDLSLIHI